MKAMLVVALVATPTLARADDPKIPAEKYVLPNGLEVILAPDPAVPIVAVNVWYHVGSGYEVPGRSGFAHLFEHLMFQGTKNTGPDAHFKVLRKTGATQINGTTNTDRTNYFEVVPSNQLETALWLESERMGHLLGALDTGQMANQIDVVRNERRQNYDNRPYSKARWAMYAALYPEGHPYRYQTIGKHEDIECASVDDVVKFFKTWYVPANATLAIVGDFDVPATKALIEKWFGSFPASHKPKVVPIAAPEVPVQEITVDDSFAKLRQITFAWSSPANFGDGDAELDFVADALAKEGTGRLYKTLVYDKQLAQSVRARQGGMQFSGIFQIEVTLRSGADLVEVKKAVLEEVERLAKEPLGAKEMAREVAEREAEQIYALEDLNARANILQAYNHYLGDPDRLSFDLDRYRKTTPEKIRATVARVLDPAHAVIVITNPSTEAKEPPAAPAKCGGAR